MSFGLDLHTYDCIFWCSWEALCITLCYLSGSCLAYETLRHSPCFQRIIQAKTSDMRMSTYSLYSGEVFDFSVHSEVSHF